MDADAIVIGAGAAGLAAARSLAEQSLQVILVEARDRVGGRVWPRQITGSSTPAELGAEFIHGPADQTKALLREANVEVAGTAGASWLCDRGELVRDREDFTASAHSLEGARALAVDETAAQYLQRLARDKSTRGTEESARAFIEGFEAADPAIASAQAIADELHSGVDDLSARPVGGYGAMLELLRHKCDAAGVRILLSTIVQRISWRRNAVAVDVQKLAAGPRTLRARAAIVTLPIGVLKCAGDETGVTFNPELPAIKRNALLKLEMGHVVKVVLSFRTAFWEHIRDRRYRDAAYFRCNDQPFGVYWTLLPVRSTLIVAWAGGPKATALTGRSEANLIDLALDSFSAVFDESKLAHAEFVGGVMHDWNNDAFARGAYSYVLVGGGDARQELGAPVDETLFFAGEATSVDGQGGTVNGALVTGERTASAAAQALGQKGPGYD